MESSEEPIKLPRHDLWLLPLIAFATVAVILAAAEAGARIAFAEQKQNACMVPDMEIGYHMAANCNSRMKAAEGPWYTNTYNECGYRSPDPCKSVSDGTRRIAFVGSSLTGGYLVPWDQTVAGRLAADLSSSCHVLVQSQNLGGLEYRGKILVTRMDEALRLRPQLVVTLILPFDVESLTSADAPNTGQLSASSSQINNVVGADDGLQKRVFAMLTRSRIVLVLQHYLFRDPAKYIPLYLHYGDKADFLRPPFSRVWQARLLVFEETISVMAERAHHAGVPFVLVFVPQEAQLLLLSNRKLMEGVDPAALGQAIAKIAARHDVLFIDASDALSRQPDPVSLYYQVDAHPLGKGQTIIADDLAQHIVDGRAAPFADCRHPIIQTQVRR